MQWLRIVAQLRESRWAVECAEVGLREEGLVQHCDV
jgi:hypothetical protein